MPIGYFHGASQDHGDRCGANSILILVDNTIIKLRLGSRKGTNTRGGIVGTLVSTFLCS